MILSIVGGKGVPGVIHASLKHGLNVRQRTVHAEGSFYCQDVKHVAAALTARINETWR